MNEFFLLVAAFGVTFGLQHKCPWLWGKSDFLDKMLSCTYCTGFHAGWISWVLFVLGKAFIDSSWLTKVSWTDGILFAFASAAFSYFADTATRWLESNSEPLEVESEEVDDVHH